METQLLNWLIEEGMFLIISFVLGVFLTHRFVKSVYDDRIDHLKILLNESDDRCLKRLGDLHTTIDHLRKRVYTLEDSRMFILTNYIKNNDQSTSEN